jgi:rsbT co-antagonist protein RsbR
MSDEATVTVTQARVQRMIDVLSLISLDEFDPALTTIASSGSTDSVAYLEESLNVFVRELGQAKREREEHVAGLEERGRELAARLATIEQQRAAIRDLSTPVIELWDEILTLPVVGAVDTERSLEMTTRLLEAVSKGGYRCVIVDLTGVDVVDTATADHFIKMIRGAELLGAHCVVTGVSPEIAQTLVEVGVDLGGIRTLRTLKDGLKHCFRMMRKGPRG